jgi:hypothetical protein
MYFEFKYYQTNVRQRDMEAAWGISHQCINRVKDCKIALEMAAFRSWPRFATFAEDKDLRNPQKWVRYDGCRVIQWDMTNCPALAFADASLYRATFSEYFGMNCLKVLEYNSVAGWFRKNHGLERQMTGHIIQTLVTWMSRRNFKNQIKLMERLLSSAIFWIEDTEVMMQHI